MTEQRHGKIRAWPDGREPGRSWLEFYAVMDDNHEYAVAFALSETMRETLADSLANNEGALLIIEDK